MCPTTRPTGSADEYRFSLINLDHASPYYSDEPQDVSGPWRVDIAADSPEQDLSWYQEQFHGIVMRDSLVFASIQQDTLFLSILSISSIQRSGQTIQEVLNETPRVEK